MVQPKKFKSRESRLPPTRCFISKERGFLHFLMKYFILSKNSHKNLVRQPCFKSPLASFLATSTLHLSRPRPPRTTQLFFTLRAKKFIAPLLANFSPPSIPPPRGLSSRSFDASSPPRAPTFRRVITGLPLKSYSSLPDKIYILVIIILKPNFPVGRLYGEA